MQKVHSLRSEVRGSAGFTLVELMVTLAVLVVVAAIAFAGMRQNEFSGQARRFVADAEGVIVNARNQAIDNQTQVQVVVDAQSLTIMVLNQDTNVWLQTHAVSLAGPGADLLTLDNTVCIYGLDAGVQTPAQAVDVVPPNDCIGGQQILQFEPDGSFTDPLADWSTVLDNAGVSLWIGDRSVPTNHKLSVVQVFPGGLVRRFDGIAMGT